METFGGDPRVAQIRYEVNKLIYFYYVKELFFL